MSRQVAYVWGGVVLALIVASPWGEALSSGLWPCTFKSLTGFACPTCGTTRAALLLARFDVVGALTQYPLAALGWMGFVLGGLYSLAATLVGKTPPPIPTSLPPWARVGVVAAIAVNWVYLIATGA